MELMDNIILQLESAIEEEIKSYQGEDVIMSKAEIKILGQISLLLDKEASANLTPVATMDLDAILKTEWFLQKALRDILKQKGLEYDELSSEIWIPEEAEFIIYHESSRLIISYIDPVSALTCKAIKAREKNKFLVKRALEYYGEKLSGRIKKYGGDLEYFKN